MPIRTNIKTVRSAQREIRSVLERYGLQWTDIAPDMDEILWRTIAPTARDVRRSQFIKIYPSLYGKNARKG